MIDVIFIGSMMLVTFLPRVIPLALASRMHLPAAIQQALTYVPIAVLTIIVVQTVFYAKGQLFISLQNPYILASAAALVASLLQSRLFVTIILGLITYGAALFFLR